MVSFIFPDKSNSYSGLATERDLVAREREQKTDG